MIYIQYNAALPLAKSRIATRFGGEVEFVKVGAQPIITFTDVGGLTEREKGRVIAQAIDAEEFNIWKQNKERKYYPGRLITQKLPFLGDQFWVIDEDGEMTNLRNHNGPSGCKEQLPVCYAIPLHFSGPDGDGLLTRNNHFYPKEVLEKALAKLTEARDSRVPVVIRELDRTDKNWFDSILEIDRDAVVTGEFHSDGKPGVIYFKPSPEGRKKLDECFVGGGVNTEFAIGSMAKHQKGKLVATEIVSFDLVPKGQSAGVPHDTEVDDAGIIGDIE